MLFRSVPVPKKPRAEARGRVPRLPQLASGAWRQSRGLTPFGVLALPARLRRHAWPGYSPGMRIEVEQEDDQRWIAEVLDLPGVIVYGETRERAVAKAEALALRVIADRLDHGESIPELDDLFVVSA